MSSLALVTRHSSSPFYSLYVRIRYVLSTRLGGLSFASATVALIILYRYWQMKEEAQRRSIRSLQPADLDLLDQTDVLSPTPQQQHQKHQTPTEQPQAQNTYQDAVQRSVANENTENTVTTSPILALFPPIIQQLLHNYRAGTEDGWTYVQTKDEVEVWKKEVDGLAIPFVRGSGIIAAPVSWIIQTVASFDLAIKQQMDPMLDGIEILERVDENTTIAYLSSRRSWPLSPRDFVRCQHIQRTDTLTMTASTSVTHHSKPADVNGYVRAEVKMAGWICEPLEPVNGIPSTRVTYLTLMNLNGSIPAAVVKMVAMSQPASVARLAALASKVKDFTPYEKIEEERKQRRKVAEIAVTMPSSDASAHSSHVVHSSSPPSSPTAVTSSASFPPASFSTPVSNRSLSSATPSSTSLSRSNSLMSPVKQFRPLQFRSEEQQQMLEMGREACKHLVQCTTLSGWRRVNVSKAVEIWSRTEKGTPILSFMGRGVVRCSPETIYNAVRDPAFRRQYDRMCKDIQLLHVLDDHASIVYMHHSTTQCLAKIARDFVLLHCAQPATEHCAQYVFSASSVSLPECPARPSITRAELHASGWLIEPLIIDDAIIAGASLVTYVVRTDLKGSIPTSVLNLLSERQPLVIHYVRGLLEKKTEPQTPATPAKSVPATPHPPATRK